MKLDKYIKDNFINVSSSNPIKFLYLLFHKYIKKNSKKSYSFGGIDLLISHFFRKQSNGIYLDVGCYHPIQGSNTHEYSLSWRDVQHTYSSRYIRNKHCAYFR